MKKTLTLLDLFSGIGGFSYGFERTNRIKTIAFCEKDKFCQTVLNKHWQGIKIYDDIRNINGSEIKADIITGGFPCQPFSVAGKRRGKDDDRYLWDETLRVVAETKPRWFVGENVEGIINIDNGSVLQQIQKDLEAENFEVQCLVIPASGVGAWHQRKRVWIIGCNVSNTNNSGCQNRTEQHRWQQTQSKQRFDSFSRSNIISNSDSYGSHRQERNETKQSSNQSEKRLSIGNDKDVPNTDSISCSEEQQRRTNKKLSKESSRLERWENQRQTRNEFRSSSSNASNTNSKRSQRHGVSTDMETEQRQVITERSIEEQQTWWQTQSKLCGVPNGISYELDKDRNNRIKALGNSIVPEIAYLIATSILKAEDGKKETFFT